MQSARLPCTLVNVIHCRLRACACARGLCGFVCMRVSVCVCASVYVRVCVCARAHVCVCAYVCMYVRVRACARKFS